MYISKNKLSYPITFVSDSSLIKNTLSIDYDVSDYNFLINELVESATELTEGQINQDIAYTNNVIQLNDVYNYIGWGLNGYSWCDNVGHILRISQGNLSTVLGIVNNDTSTLITSYTVQKDYSDFIIKFEPQISCKSLTINFTTGWQNSNDVPKALKYAILVKTTDLYYKQRGSYIDNYSKYDSTWEKMCQQYKLL